MQLSLDERQLTTKGTMQLSNCATYLFIKRYVMPI